MSHDVTGASAASPPGHAPAALPDAQRNNWVDTRAPARLRPYLKLARLDRPIGSWLLLLPCWWAAGLAATAAGHTHSNLWHMVLFAIGAVAMRAEHEIGIDAEQAVAPAHFAALHRLKQEIAASGLDQLERRADRGFGIGEELAPDQRGLAQR